MERHQEMNVAKQVLDGVKVADFSWVAVMPLSTRMLADYGATVVKVESYARPDILRSFPPFKDNIQDVDHNGFFPNYNCNKYGMTLDLRNPHGIEFAKRLISWADIVAESFTPGVMQRWGLGYEDVKKIKRDIIMVSACMQGQTGPRKNLTGYGTQLASLSGVTRLLGWADRMPSMPYGAYTDFIVPWFIVTTLVAALEYRRRTGKGQYLDFSQYETGLEFLSPLLLDYTVNRRVTERAGNRCPYAAPHGVYPCRGSDRWCAIAVFTDGEWEAACQVLGNRELAKDPKFSTLLARKQNEDELDKIISALTTDFTAQELMERMQNVSVAAGVVCDIEEVFNDPQLKHREHFWFLDHPVLGKHSYDSPSFKLSKTPANPRMAAPCLGQHNEYVCTQILGMPDEEFTSLLSNGAFG